METYAKLSAQLPLYSLPAVPPWLISSLWLPRIEHFHQIPATFALYKQASKQRKTKHHHHRHQKFIPKCSGKGRGNGNISIQSEDFVLALMLFPNDLDLSFFSFLLFSMWVRGQEHRENWFSPFFFFYSLRWNLENSFCFVPLNKKIKNQQVARKSLPFTFQFEKIRCWPVFTLVR